MLYPGATVDCTYDSKFRAARPDEPYTYHGHITNIDGPNIFIDFGADGVFRFEKLSSKNNTLMDIDGFEIKVKTLNSPLDKSRQRQYAPKPLKVEKTIKEDKNILDLFLKTTEDELNQEIKVEQRNTRDFTIPELSASVGRDAESPSSTMEDKKSLANSGNQLRISHSPISLKSQLRSNSKDISVGDAISVLYSESFQQEFPGEPYDYTGIVTAIVPETQFENGELVIDFGVEGEFAYKKKRDSFDDRNYFATAGNDTFNDSQGFASSPFETQQNNNLNTNSRPTSRPVPGVKPAACRRPVQFASFEEGKRLQRVPANDSSSGNPGSLGDMTYAMSELSKMEIPNWRDHCDALKEGKWQGKRAALVAIQEQCERMGSNIDKFHRGVSSFCYQLTKKFTERNFNVIASAIDVITVIAMAGNDKHKKFPRGIAALIMPILLKQVGDRRIGASIKSLAGIIGECCGVKWMIRLITDTSKKKSFKDPKALAAVLDIIATSSTEFGPNAVDLDAVVKYVSGPKGVAHHQGRVVNGAAVKTLGVLYTLVGQPVKDILEEMQTSNKIMKQLKTAFEAGDVNAKIKGGFTPINRNKSLNKSLNASKHKSPKKSHSQLRRSLSNQRNSPTKRGGSFLGSTLTSSTSNNSNSTPEEEEKASQNDDIERMDISPFITDDLLKNLLDFSKTDSWKQRKLGLEECHEIMTKRAKYRIIVNRTLEKLIKILKDRSLEKNATLKIKALKIIGILGLSIERNHPRRSEMTRWLAPAIVETFADKKRATLAAGISALSRWSSGRFGLSGILPSTCASLVDKPVSRPALLAWLLIHIPKATSAGHIDGTRMTKLLVKPLLICMNDKMKVVQKQAASVLVEVIRADKSHARLAVSEAASKFSKAIQRSIDIVLERVDTAVESGKSFNSVDQQAAKKASAKWGSTRKVLGTRRKLSGGRRRMASPVARSGRTGLHKSSKKKADDVITLVSSLDASSKIASIGIIDWKKHSNVSKDSTWQEKKDALTAICNYCSNGESNVEKNLMILLAKKSKGTFAKGHAKLIIPFLVNKLGEQMVAAKATELILMLSTRCGAKYIIGLILEAVSSIDTSLIQIAVLRLFEVMISTVGIRTFNVAAVTRHASGTKGMSSDVKSVVKAASVMLQALYKQLGPPLVNLLRAVEASNDVIEKLEASFDVCGYDINASAANTSVIPEALAAAAASSRNSRRQNVVNVSFDDAPRADISQYVTPELMALLSAQERKDSWIQRKQGLDQIESIIFEQAQQRISMSPATEKLIRSLADRAREKNLSLKLQALKLLAALGGAIDSAQLPRFSPVVVPPMIDALADNKVNARRAGFEALEAWSIPRDGPYQGRSYGFASIVPKVRGPLVNKPTVRPELLAWLLKHIPVAASTGLIDSARLTKQLVKPLVACMQDKKKVVQKQAASVLIEVVRADPSRASFALSAAVSKLPRAVQRGLQTDLDRIHTEGRAALNNGEVDTSQSNQKAVTAPPKLRRHRSRSLGGRNNGIEGKDVLAVALGGALSGYADGDERFDISFQLRPELIAQMQDCTDRNSWTERRDAMIELDKILKKAHASGGICLTRKVAEVLRVLKARCLEKNMLLRVKALQLTAGFGRCISLDRRKKVVAICTPSICEAVADMKASVRDAALDALEAWTVDGNNSPVCLGDILPCVCEPLRKRPATRGELLHWCLHWLPIAIRLERERLNIARICKIMIKPLVVCMEDRSKVINRQAASVLVHLIRAEPVVGRLSLATATANMKSAVSMALQPMMGEVLRMASIPSSGDPSEDVPAFDTPPPVRKRPGAWSNGISRVRQKLVDAREGGSQHKYAAAASAARKASRRTRAASSRNTIRRARTRSAAASAAQRRRSQKKRRSPLRGNRGRKNSDSTSPFRIENLSPKVSIKTEMSKPDDVSDVVDMLSAKAEIARYRQMLKSSLRLSMSTSDIEDTKKHERKTNEESPTRPISDPSGFLMGVDQNLLQGLKGAQKTSPPPKNSRESPKQFLKKPRSPPGKLKPLVETKSK